MQKYATTQREFTKNFVKLLYFTPTTRNNNVVNANKLFQYLTDNAYFLYNFVDINGDQKKINDMNVIIAKKLLYFAYNEGWDAGVYYLNKLYPKSSYIDNPINKQKKLLYSYNRKFPKYY